MGTKVPALSFLHILSRKLRTTVSCSWIKSGPPGRVAIHRRHLRLRGETRRASVIATSCYWSRMSAGSPVVPIVIPNNVCLWTWRDRETWASPGPQGVPLHYRGDEAYAHRVTNQADYSVDLEPLHYLAAMAFHGFYTQVETVCDFFRAMAFCNHSQHLDLSGRELVERATQLNRLGDRSGETAEICLQYQVLGTGADAGHRCFAIECVRHKDQRGRGPDILKQ